MVNNSKNLDRDQEIPCSLHLNPLSSGIADSLCDHPIEPVKRTLKVEYESSISEHCNDLEDPRKLGMVKHNLLDIITISICAMVCVAYYFGLVETFSNT
jgi:hypothetical protein